MYSPAVRWKSASWVVAGAPVAGKIDNNRDNAAAMEMYFINVA
jgi:hypothetical protein